MNKKNPLLLTAPPLAPPAFRSRAAIALAAIAAEGRFALQVCTACATVQYPARDACQACLSTTLAWRDVPSGGQILARTIIRASADPYFRLRLPWPIATIALDCGPSVIAHLHGDATDRVRMTLRLDKSGQAVMLAMPAEDTPTMQDDPILREMTCDPSDRRVLITDGRSAIGQAMAAALTQAGAATVFAGIADPWKPYKKLVGEVPLDLTDETSVRTFAAEFGARVDIVINTALHLRPGNILDRRDTITAHEDMEAAYFGPLRLAQSLGPALRARTADGARPACAWVNLLSVYALAPAPGFSALAAAQAAGLSLAQALRTELCPLRVINALIGPPDDAWHAALPPPKLAPTALANAIVRALRDGIEDLAIGDIAQDVLARWKNNPMMLARELGEKTP